MCAPSESLQDTDARKAVLYTPLRGRLTESSSSGGIMIMMGGENLNTGLRHEYDPVRVTVRRHAASDRLNGPDGASRAEPGLAGPAERTDLHSTLSTAEARTPPGTLPSVLQRVESGPPAGPGSAGQGASEPP